MKNLGIALKHATLKKLHNFKVHTIFIGLSAVVHTVPFFFSVSRQRNIFTSWPILRLKGTTRIQIKNKALSLPAWAISRWFWQIRKKQFPYFPSQDFTRVTPDAFTFFISRVVHGREQ